MTYELSLEGKTALITAAGQGIGRASAEAFANAGASVIATDINETALTELEGYDGITALKLDATKPEDIKRVLAEAGELDVLFNCAGFVHAGNILESTEEDWDFAFDLNAKAMYRLCKAVLPGMLEQGKGSIINMSSVASSLKGVPNRFVYCASKAAVIGMTKAFDAMQFVLALWIAHHCMTGCAQLVTMSWRESNLLPASPWVALAQQTKLRCLQFTWPLMPVDLPRAKRISSTAAGPSKRRLL